jgi:hypothetical protein
VPRRPRSQLPEDGVYHVTARGVAGLPIFLDDLDRLDFMSLLRAAGETRSLSGTNLTSKRRAAMFSTTRSAPASVRPMSHGLGPD